MKSKILSKRLLSVLLALIMVLGLLPMSAFAAVTGDWSSANPKQIDVENGNTNELALATLLSNTYGATSADGYRKVGASSFGRMVNPGTTLTDDGTVYELAENTGNIFRPNFSSTGQYFTLRTYYNVTLNLDIPTGGKVTIDGVEYANGTTLKVYKNAVAGETLGTNEIVLGDDGTLALAYTAVDGYDIQVSFGGAVQSGQPAAMPVSASTTLSVVYTSAQVTVNNGGSGSVSIGGATVSGSAPATVQMAPGTATVVVTPNAGYYTEVVVTDSTGAEVALTGSYAKTDVDSGLVATDYRNVYTGSFAVANGESYTVTVTYGQNPLSVPTTTGEISVNGYLTDKASGLKEKVLDAIFGAGNYTADDYTVEMNVNTLGYTNVDSTLNAGTITGALDVPGTETFKITGPNSDSAKYPDPYAIVTITVNETRGSVTITETDYNEPLEMDSLWENGLSADAFAPYFTVTADLAYGSVTVTPVDGQELGAENETKDIQFTVTVLGNTNYVTTSKVITIPVHNTQYLTTVTVENDAVAGTVSGVADGDKLVTGSYDVNVEVNSGNGYTNYVTDVTVSDESASSISGTITESGYQGVLYITNDDDADTATTVTVVYGKREIVVTGAAAKVFFNTDKTYSEQSARILEAVFNAVVDTANTAGIAYGTNATVAFVNGDPTGTGEYSVVITWDDADDTIAPVVLETTVELVDERQPAEIVYETVEVKVDEAADVTVEAILAAVTAAAKDSTANAPKVEVTGELTVPAQGETVYIEVTITIEGNDYWDDGKVVTTVPVTGLITPASVTVTTDGNGTIAGIENGDYNTGEYEITLTPNAGYYVDTLTINGVAVEYAEIADGVYTMVIADGTDLELGAEVAAYEIEATFVAPTFTITDGQINYYIGMDTSSLPTDVQTAVNPVFKPETEATSVTTYYLAREAGTYVYNVVIDLSEYGFDSYTVSLDIPLTEQWLNIGEEYQEFVEPTTAQITAAALDLIDNLIFDGMDSFEAALAEALAPYFTYYQAHQFGELEVETVKLVHTSERFGDVESNPAEVTLIDLRTPTYITLNEGVEMTYGFTADELMDALLVGLYDENGSTLSYDVEFVTAVEGMNASEDAQTVVVKFAGNDTYQDCTAEVTIIVNKDTATVTVPNNNITYGDEYTVDVTVKNSRDQVVDINTIEFMVGIDVGSLNIDLESGAITGLNTQVQIFLPETFDTILEYIGVEEGVEFDVSTLITLLSENASILTWLGVSEEEISTLQTTLNTINDLGAATIVIGGDLPTATGAYLYGAITANSNYETALGVGYIIIKPVTEQVYLKFDYEDNNNIFTPELLQHNILGASAYNDEAKTELNSEATAYVQNLYFGIDANGELALEVNVEDIGIGAYTQMSFVLETGNHIYYAEPIVRAFVIVPNTVEVEIVVDGADVADSYTTTFDNAPVDVTANLTYTQGNVVNPSQENLTFTYVGIQTNTKSYNDTVAPTHAGVYVVIATYVEKDGEDIVAVGFDVATLTIKPADTTINVENLTVEYGTEVNFIEDMITVETDSGVTMPDVTVISGTVSIGGDFATEGWAAVEGNVNIDFPAWVDALLTEYAPSIYDGMTAAEFTAKVTEKLPAVIDEISAMAAEYGVEIDLTEIKDTLTAALAEVQTIVDQLPAEVNLTFDDALTEADAGIYAVAAVVTDSDHMPSVDAGILTISLSDALIVDIKDTTVDYNGEEQMPEYTATIDGETVTTDMVYVIVDEESVANLILEEDSQAILDMILEQLEMTEVPENLTVGQIQTALEGIVEDIKNQVSTSAIAAAVEALGMDTAGISNLITEMENTMIGYLTQMGLTSDTVVTINGAKPVDAGTYQVCGLAVTSNYAPEATEGTLVIEPIEIVVTMGEDTKTYGETDALTYTVTVNGVVDEDGVVDGLTVTTGRADGSEGEDVGTYITTAAAEHEDSKNYVVTVEDGTLTIEPAEVTITVTTGDEDNTINVGETLDNAALTVVVTEPGVVTETELAAQIVYIDAEGNVVTAFDKAGTYTITATYAESENYTVTVNSAEVTVIDGLFDIYAANIKAGDSLDMYFYVEKADLNGTDYYAVVTKTFADGREDVVATIPYSEWESYNASLIRFSFDDISAKEMTDEIYVTVYNTDGTVASNLWTDSVRDYAVRAMKAYSDTELLAALIDMLNYGAAAQDYFDDYNIEDLANAGLDEYQQYATTTVTYEDSSVKGENYAGTTVSAKNKLVLTMYFQNITTDMTAYVTYTDHYGNEETLTVSGSEFVALGSLYGVDVTGLSIADGRQLMSCEVRDSEGNVVASGTDSVESYVARVSTQDVVFELLMKFVDSAYNYFH